MKMYISRILQKRRNKLYEFLLAPLKMFKLLFNETGKFLYLRTFFYHRKRVVIYIAECNNRFFEHKSFPPCGAGLGRDEARIFDDRMRVVVRMYKLYIRYFLELSVILARAKTDHRRMILHIEFERKRQRLRDLLYEVELIGPVWR